VGDERVLGELDRTEGHEDGDNVDLRARKLDLGAFEVDHERREVEQNGVLVEAERREVEDGCAHPLYRAPL